MGWGKIAYMECYVEEMWKYWVLLKFFPRGRISKVYLSFLQRLEQQTEVWFHQCSLRGTNEFVVLPYRGEGLLISVWMLLLKGGYTAKSSLSGNGDFPTAIWMEPQLPCSSSIYSSLSQRPHGVRVEWHTVGGWEQLDNPARVWAVFLVNSITLATLWLLLLLGQDGQGSCSACPKLSYGPQVIFLWAWWALHCLCGLNQS